MPIALAVVLALHAFVAGLVVQRKVNGQSAAQPQAMAQPSNYLQPHNVPPK